MGSPGIAEQILLAAWEHELRGPHGEWISYETGRLKLSQLPDAGGLARRKYTQDELAAVVRREGIGRPIVLRHDTSGVYIANGRHRAAVARALGLADVPVIIQHAEGVNPRSVPLRGRKPSTAAEFERHYQARPGLEPSLGSAFRKIGKVAGEAFPGFAPGAQQVWDKPHPGVHSTLPGGSATPGQVRAATAEIQHGLDAQARYVPHIAAGQDIELRQNIPGGNELTFGMTVPGTGDIIDISPIATDALNGGRSKEGLAGEISKGWWVPSDPGVTLADRTVAHEVGHVVADHIDPAETDKMWPQLAKILGVPPPGKVLRDGEWVTDPTWTGGYGDKIKPQVSEYACTNPPELQAELWCEYTTTARPRPAAKFYGDWAMAHVQDPQLVSRQPVYEQGGKFGDVGQVSFLAPGVVSNAAPLRKALAEVQHGLDRQNKIIPQIAAHQQITIHDLSDRRELGETDYPADTIEISPKVCQTINSMASAEKIVQTRKGFWPPTDPDVSLADLIVAHEMGHVVADHVSEQDMRAMWAGLAEAMGLPPPDMTRSDFAEDWVMAHAAKIRKQVSEYGSRDYQELQGELWSEYSTNSHPRPAAKFYGDYVLAHLSAKQVITG